MPSTHKQPHRIKIASRALGATFWLLDFRNKTRKYPLLDVLRALAVINMIIYHGCYFLQYYGIIELDFHTQAWDTYQRAIAATFFLLLGVSLKLATAAGQPFRLFLPRIARIACYALVMTAGSYIVNRQGLVVFGVLHCMTLSSLAGLFFTRLRLGNAALGVLAIILPQHYSAAHFNSSLLYWTGLATQTPATFDFQPFFPWFGVTLLGIALAPRLMAIAVLKKPLNGTLWRGLQIIGQNSLVLYVAHAPILIGLIEIWSWLRK